MKLLLKGSKEKLSSDAAGLFNSFAVKEMDILDHIEKILSVSRKYGIEKCIAKGKIHFDFIAKKLHISPLQAVIFSHLLNKDSDEYNKINEIAESLRCSRVKILKYIKEFETLERMKIIRCKRSTDGISFRIPSNFQESLLLNEELKHKKINNFSIYKFFTYIKRVFKEREDEEYTYESMKLEILDIINHNMHLLFCQKIKNYDLDDDNLIILLCFCHLFRNKQYDDIMFYQLEFMYDSLLDYMELQDALIGGKHILMEMKLVEYANDNGFAKQDTWKLTDNAKKDLFSELNDDIINNRNIIRYKNINKKLMYYNSRETGEIQKLTSLLQEENNSQIIKRLNDKGMRKGLACLFSGGPGTGKTETVYQIALETKRDILFVDISDTKCMWYGGSEKIIKGIFNTYRRLVELSKIVPILLINEADAIIGKRHEIGSGNGTIDQTENTIQNIILQEIENLSGILIATSNLIQNMDKAYERRFLFKITFEKPCMESRKNIWHTMLPQLSDDGVIKLAKEFEISGGQIENIARKVEVDAILSGEELLTDNLTQYCKDEIFNRFNANKKIGFGT
jgi:hypothetical protein